MQLRELARRRPPRVAFDFVDGGADDEVTLKRNRTGFDDVALIPRVLRGFGDVSTEIELFGQRLRMPLLLAPAGAELVAGPKAHIAAAREADAAGTISILGGGRRQADRVAASSSKRQWCQLYLTRNRAENVSAVEEAKRLGFAALVLTVDALVTGNRERYVRNGLTVPLRIMTARIAFDAARRPRWLREYFAGGVRERGREVTTLAEDLRAWLDPAQSWDDVRWLRSVWEGPRF